MGLGSRDWLPGVAFLDAPQAPTLQPLYALTPIVHGSHLLHVLLVEDFLHGDELDDAPALLVERGALLLGVGGVAEGDEEAAAPNGTFATVLKQVLKALALEGRPNMSRVSIMMGLGPRTIQ